MSDILEKLKKKRTILRSAVTKLINTINECLTNEQIDFEKLNETLSLLNLKSSVLTEVDTEIDPLLNLDEYDTEKSSTYDYCDKISIATIRAERKLKENETFTNLENSQSNQNQISNQSTNIENNCVKLPKLNIQKFAGDCTQFTSFWNTFKVTIHENKSLSNVEKFNYLKSYLIHDAFYAIEGLEISEINYEAAIKILKDRFGQRETIINHHMNRLLNLKPVFKSSDIFKLKKMHSEIEINIRSLSALGLESESYSSMLVAAVLKLIPSELALEWNRRHAKNSKVSDIQDFLDFLQTEIISRERTFVNRNRTDFPNNKNKISRPKTEVHEFIASVTPTNHARHHSESSENCLFCSNSHASESCDSIDVETKRNTLKSQSRCFLCLKPKHRIKDCNSKNKCIHCRGRHNGAICFKFYSPNTEKTDSNTIETETKNEIVSAVSHHTGKNKNLLQTCCVKVRNREKEKIARTLLDSGSMRTFVSKNLADSMKFNIIRKEKLSVFTFGSKIPIQKTYDVVQFTLENKYSENSKLNIEALVADSISGSYIPPPELKNFKDCEELKYLTLADSPQSKEPISILVGADYYYSVVLGNVKHLNKSLVAVETIFGWCLLGKNSEDYISLNMNIIVEENLISEQIKKFWDLETSGLINCRNDFDPTESEIMQQFESEVKYENKRYEVTFPWKLEKHRLNDNLNIAKTRFARLRERFCRIPELYFEYKTVLDNYLKEGIIESVSNLEKENSVTFYLPHREIIKRDRETSKLRIVFDASSHNTDCFSLNKCLNIGPNLYPEIFDILCRFRFHAIAFTTDMRQAFLQIEVNKLDRDVTRFLFTEDPSDESKPLQTFRFARVLFGLNCSPFLLAATIKHHLKKYTKEYPETVEFLNENVYVDDIIGSHPSIESAFSTSLQSIKIFEDASMQLHKWHTNSKHLRELWVQNDTIPYEKSKSLEVNESNKVLGLGWNNKEDSLYFDIRDLTEFVAKSGDTKRFVLQVLGRIYDPIGFLGPYTVRIKCLMQKIWSLGLDWDDILPEDLNSDWKKWCGEIPQLSNFAVPRHYFLEVPNHKVENLQLHLFSDASMKAFGTIAYFRVTAPNEEIRTVFVASKNRVAPLKRLTLPRLELLAALLSAKLSSNVLKALKIDIPCYYWTDSKITYFWIKGSADRFKPFVRNRVEEIHKLTSPSDWFHCPGVTNPADLASRGAKISTLINEKIWLSGPDWLSLPPELWPKSEKEAIDVNELEYKNNFSETLQCECLVEETVNPLDISRFSSLERLLRVTAWVKRFVKCLKNPSEKRDTLTTEEILDAENHLIKSEQKQYFKDEYESLTNGYPIEKNSFLHNYSPFLDDNKVMRLGGRLEFGDLSTEEKHPIILPKHSWLTVLIVRHEHNRVMHGGTANTLSKVRKRFWIPKGRQLVKSVIKRCIVCKKYLAKPTDQLTAPLPKDRITEAPPFSICGLDFAGPIYVKDSKEVKKSYIVLFTCGVTRALHLELVHDMSTDSFLLAFRRFLARRLNCKVIYSDNAKTFKRAKTEIQELYRILSHKSLVYFFAKERIIWKNIIERAAWWGGFYERLVKSVKESLRKIIGKALLSYEEMSTLLVEVETVLNLRPLTYVYNETDEPCPLTPMHFLNFGKEISYPINFADIIENASKRSSALKRKRYQTLLLKQLWSRWKTEYLLDLKTAHSLKNPTKQSALKIGDVVLIGEDTKNKLLWKLGKIEKAIVGRDNNIRAYEVKTANGILKRTVQHLYPLELT